MGLVGRKVRVSLGGKTIVHNVDFKATRGELVGILGPSGCGKTTLLMALSGFRPPTEGKVLFDGTDLLKNFEELKREIGFVPQDDVVPLALRVERALGYTAELRLQGFEPEERQGRVDGVIRTLGLEGVRKQRVRNLSGGQRKRVSVGMELISRPSLIFADEPTSGLDPALERGLTETFRELASQDRVVVVTTHIMSSLDLLDRVCVLTAGRLAFLGAPGKMKEFFEVDDFIEIYGKLQSGSPESWASRFRKSSVGQEALS